MGVGEAHKACSHRVEEEGTIGSQQRPQEGEVRSRSNFPSKKKLYDHEKDLGEFAGRVSIGDTQNPICIAVNSSKTILWRTAKVNQKRSFMVESRESPYLGVRMNSTLVTPSKSGLVSVILINNNSHNVWI